MINLSGDFGSNRSFWFMISWSSSRFFFFGHGFSRCLWFFLRSFWNFFCLSWNSFFSWISFFSWCDFSWSSFLSWFGFCWSSFLSWSWGRINNSSFSFCSIVSYMSNIFFRWLFSWFLLWVFGRRFNNCVCCFCFIIIICGLNFWVSLLFCFFFSLSNFISCFFF